MEGKLYWDDMTKTYWKMVSGFGSDAGVRPQGHPDSQFKFITVGYNVMVSGWFEEVPKADYPRFITTTATGV